MPTLYYTIGFEEGELIDKLSSEGSTKCILYQDNKCTVVSMRKGLKRICLILGTTPNLKAAVSEMLEHLPNDTSYYAEKREVISCLRQTFDIDPIKIKNYLKY